MKCFVSKCIGSCEGGLFLVAAESAENALNVAKTSEDAWAFEYCHMTEFEEICGLEYDTPEPCVIECVIYAE